MMREKSAPTFKYDPVWVQQHYDTYGMQEWNRWESSPATRIAFAVHSHYLQRYVRPGERVLEIGAGAGRFTQLLANITSHITVADISSVQLSLNRHQADVLGFDAAIEQWVQCDVCDMSGHFVDGEFDTVVAYGGLLSYVCDQAERALSEIRRVTKYGGRIFLEVMSLWGAVHYSLPGVLSIPVQLNRSIIALGNLDRKMGISKQHIHMYRAKEFRQLLKNAGLSVELLSATAVLSSNWDDRLAILRDDGDEWQHLIEMELEACREPGCVDLGPHIITLCRNSCRESARYQR
ncbi:MAG: methyltransferase domain-containing protein [Armatimonadota bacterium]